MREGEEEIGREGGRRRRRRGERRRGGREERKGRDSTRGGKEGESGKERLSSLTSTCARSSFVQSIEKLFHTRTHVPDVKWKHVSLHLFGQQGQDVGDGGRRGGGRGGTY